MALRLLTGLPLPAAGKPTPGRVGGSMVWFPAVGAALGVALGLAERGVRLTTHSHALACATVVGLGLLVSQGRPIRGLMVLSGALFAGRDSEGLGRLAMQPWPTRFGLLTGTALLLLKYALLMALPGDARLAALLRAGGLSRAAIVWVCWRFPYAPLDEGIAAWLAALARPRDLVLVLPVAALGSALLGPLPTLAALLGAGLPAHGFAAWVAKALDGLTAHACEATAEVGELGALAAVAALAHFGLG